MASSESSNSEERDFVVLCNRNVLLVKSPPTVHQLKKAMLHTSAIVIATVLAAIPCTDKREDYHNMSKDNIYYLAYLLQASNYVTVSKDSKDSKLTIDSTTMGMSLETREYFLSNALEEHDMRVFPANYIGYETPELSGELLKLLPKAMQINFNYDFVQPKNPEKPTRFEQYCITRSQHHKQAQKELKEIRDLITDDDESLDEVITDDEEMEKSQKEFHKAEAIRIEEIRKEERKVFDKKIDDLRGMVNDLRKKKTANDPVLQQASAAASSGK
jgi:hypothetical protein